MSQKDLEDFGDLKLGMRSIIVAIVEVGGQLTVVRKNMSSEKDFLTVIEKGLGKGYRLSAKPLMTAYAIFEAAHASVEAIPLQNFLHILESGLPQNVLTDIIAGRAVTVEAKEPVTKKINLDDINRVELQKLKSELTKSETRAEKLLELTAKYELDIKNLKEELSLVSTTPQIPAVKAAPEVARLTNLLKKREAELAQLKLKQVKLDEKNKEVTIRRLVKKFKNFFRTDDDVDTAELIHEDLTSSQREELVEALVEHEDSLAHFKTKVN